MKIKDREEPSDLSDAIYKQMANITIMVTQLVVEFAKHLPGFMTLNRDDQIVLLKVSRLLKKVDCNYAYRLLSIVQNCTGTIP